MSKIFRCCTDLMIRVISCCLVRQSFCIFCIVKKIVIRKCHLRIKNTRREKINKISNNKKCCIVRRHFYPREHLIVTQAANSPKKNKILDNFVSFLDTKSSVIFYLFFVWRQPFLNNLEASLLFFCNLHNESNRTFLRLDLTPVSNYDLNINK